MRVGLLIYGSLETLSGGYLYDRELAAHLRQSGDEVTVISLPWRSYPRHLGDNLSPALAARLRGLQLDVLLQDELNHPSLFWLNQRLKAALPYPMVSIVHHLRSSEQHPPAARWLYRRVERAYLRSVDGFVFNSQTTQAEVARLSGRPALGVVAYPGGDRFGRGLSDEVIRARAGQAGPLRLLFVGNLIERKGLHTLLQALARLPADTWVLNVVGRHDVDPAYAGRMVNFVRQQGWREQVRFLGKLPEDSLRELWAGSHALVMPSQYEGFGIVYLEGQSFGLPAVAGTAGAAAEIIRDGQEGFLVPPEEPAALAERLGLWLADRRQLEAMSLAARCRFDEFPTWAESMARIRAYLEGFTR